MSRALIIPNGFPSTPRLQAPRSAGARVVGGYRLWPGSGRFCGAVPEYRFIQESRHSGNDCGVGKVKDIPIEMDGLRADVEQHEVGDPFMQERINAVADGAAGDEAERHGG